MTHRGPFQPLLFCDSVICPSAHSDCLIYPPEWTTFFTFTTENNLFQKSNLCDWIVNLKKKKKERKEKRTSTAPPRNIMNFL